AINCPETVVDTNSPKTMGRVINPAPVGLNPRESWKYWLRNTEPPNIAVPTATMPTTAADTVRLRNMLSGTIGSLTFVSINRASRIAATPPPTSPAVAPDHQANWSPAMDTQISSAL